MTQDESLNLDDLVGKHVLDGVDTYIEKVKIYDDKFEDANAIRFRLDGVVYVAIEDPNDGYRSCLDKLIIAPASEITNIFPAIYVLAKKKASDTHDILQLFDVVTGKVVLEVGTDDVDDYYPCFVSSFHPENMVTNQEEL